MEKLREILSNYPDTTEVSLEKCSLTSLNEVLDYLGKLVNLKVLRLGSNFLSKLPSDMSRLRKLEYLDVSNNPFGGLDEIMSGLCSLPSLKHLYISLSEEEEDSLIINMANLQSFNGTPLTDIPDTDHIFHQNESQQDSSQPPEQELQEQQVEYNESDLDSKYTPSQ